MTKKEDVIVSARELFTKYGYRKVSLLDIANKSGVTKKTIYSYFKDKDDLFYYFIKEELENMKKNIEAKLNSAKSFPEIVSTNVHDMLEFRKNSLLISTISEDVKLGKTKESKSFLKLYDDGIIKYIEEAKKRLVSNANFDMSIDILLLKIWEEFNEKYSRC